MALIASANVQTIRLEKDKFKDSEGFSALKFRTQAFSQYPPSESMAGIELFSVCIGEFLEVSLKFYAYKLRLHFVFPSPFYVEMTLTDQSLCH